MKDELQKQLKEKYPKIFADLGTPRHTMNSISCSDGWFTLIDRLCGTIQNYIDHNSHTGVIQITATQVKQKFGELRFYHTDANSELINGMVWFAGSMSRVICEECGNPGKGHSIEGLYRTCCDLHAEETRQRIKNRTW